MVGLPAYFLGNQGGKDTILLPVIEFLQGSLKVQDFIKINKEWEKVFTLLREAIREFCEKSFRSGVLLE